jgi:hypothetical protein
MNTYKFAAKEKVIKLAGKHLPVKCGDRGCGENGEEKTNRILVIITFFGNSFIFLILLCFT